MIRINTSKEVIRSSALFLAAQEEIKTALGKQGVTDYKRIAIWKSDEENVHSDI